MNHMESTNFKICSIGFIHVCDLEYNHFVLVFTTPPLTTLAQVVKRDIFRFTRR